MIKNETITIEEKARLRFYVKVSNYATLRFIAFSRAASGALPAGSRTVRMRIAKSELTEMIAPGMPCLAEFGEHRLVTGSIEEISANGGYALLECCFNGIHLESKKDGGKQEAGLKHGLTKEDP
jgi:hypothetical protein